MQDLELRAEYCLIGGCCDGMGHRPTVTPAYEYITRISSNRRSNGNSMSAAERPVIDMRRSSFNTIHRDGKSGRHCRYSSRRDIEAVEALDTVNISRRESIALADRNANGNSLDGSQTIYAEIAKRIVHH